MNKITLPLLFAFLLSSCSMSVEQVFLLPTKTFTPSLTSTPAFTSTPTFTPTVVTPTFSLTPTLVGQKTETPTPEFSATPPATVTSLVQFTPDTATPRVAIDGFVTVFTDRNEFFKKGVCEPTSVKFTAQAANAAQTNFVVLFVRFKSKQTGATSEWTSITMENMGAGTFVHDLVSDEMKGVNSFNNSWVQYQFVATDSNINELGRTDIFDERLSVMPCSPTPSPFMTMTPSSTP